MNVRKIKYIIGIILTILIFPNVVFALGTEGTIDENYRYAWGEKIGWVNFKPTNGNVKVTDEGLTGYAWSANYGWINLSPATGGIVNDGEGNLSGHAWNDNLGWMDFSGITIDDNGHILGVAGSADSTFGRIVFTCENCNVITDWRPESIRATASKDISKTDNPTNEDDNRVKQLLDITLNIQENKITTIKDLIATVTLTNIGTEPTPIIFTYSIINESGKEVYTSIDETTVETEKTVIKTFEDVNELSIGKYTLVLNTLYNTDIENRFTQDFEIINESKTWNWWWLLLLIPVILIPILIHVKKNNKKIKAI